MLYLIKNESVSAAGGFARCVLDERTPHSGYGDVQIRINVRGRTTFHSSAGDRRAYLEDACESRIYLRWR